MKHERRIPGWLLRDLPALLGVFACFWLFVIPLITEGFRVRVTGQDTERGTFAQRIEARWRSGYAEDCKSLHAGSIPARASTFDLRIRAREGVPL